MILLILQLNQVKSNATNDYDEMQDYDEEDIDFKDIENEIIKNRSNALRNEIELKYKITNNMKQSNNLETVLDNDNQNSTIRKFLLINCYFFSFS